MLENVYEGSNARKCLRNVPDLRVFCFMQTFQMWRKFPKLGSQPSLKSVDPGPCPPKLVDLYHFFLLRKSLFWPILTEYDPQVFYIVGKLRISPLGWQKEKNISFILWCLAKHHIVWQICGAWLTPQIWVESGVRKKIVQVGRKPLHELAH